MFEKGRVYQHLCAKDLDILILYKSYEDSNIFKLKVAYLFKSNKQILCMDKIRIQKNDLQYWSEVVYDE
jgi:hypothetical protein